MDNLPKRIRLDEDDIDHSPRARLIERWKEQELYIDYLEQRLIKIENFDDKQRESQTKLDEKSNECKKLKAMLNYRFLTKTTQHQSLDQLRDVQVPSFTKLRQTYLDPAINLIFQRMRDELDACRKAREEAQNELQAWQFTPDSKTGKMLMARCKKLLEENEQLGKMVSSDNIAKLEGEISLQNRLLSEMKESQKDYEEIMQDMDQNMDAMSSTLLHMRRLLAEAHKQVIYLNDENTRLKTLCEKCNIQHSSSLSQGKQTPNEYLTTSTTNATTLSTTLMSTPTINDLDSQTTTTTNGITKPPIVHNSITNNNNNNNNKQVDSLLTNSKLKRHAPNLRTNIKLAAANKFILNNQEQKIVNNLYDNDDLSVNAGTNVDDSNQMTTINEQMETSNGNEASTMIKIDSVTTTTTTTNSQDLINHITRTDHIKSQMIMISENGIINP
ncbi:unnamed protein product [Didymodactylos carnosus]|uniref:Pre-mRNA-splicing regulator female-lethal(2)D n=1 Tax=Didymodactylos carnosus TaxID=1234261 RepID=A0A814C7B8_9BILA|nr:unnamed protein product [Didymodactylos carnosus]CAF1187618.1 unnamed protein product [Didymodactylos carnosus]CAF3713536.1 unnamed protein product [Didymodactylos carnosus]CAF3998645.1 unnamed protein product [Didymodactylos carnosus]